MLERFKSLEIKTKPFVSEVEHETSVHWIKPFLVAEFKQSINKTKAGKIRHPVIFIAFREDKDLKKVVEEEPIKKHVVKNSWFLSYNFRRDCIIKQRGSELC